MDIDAKVEEMKSPETFDVHSALNGTTYATDTVRIYRDAALAHTMNLQAEEAAKLDWEADNLEKQAQSILDDHNGMVPPDNYQPTLDQYALKRLESQQAQAKVAELLASVQNSALIFTLRGLAPAQVRLIDKKWRKAIKPPVRNNFPQGEEGTEEFELETFERNLDRNNKVNYDIIACAIVKVENTAGAVDTSAWTVEAVENLHATVLEVEYDKLRRMSQDLTFAHRIFDKALVEDADFLSKP